MSRAEVEPQAWNDIITIAEYYADVWKNPALGNQLLDEFERKSASYARQPLMGDILDDLGDNRRSFLFRRWYVAIYEPLDDGIRVLRIFDARRDYISRFQDS